MGAEYEIHTLTDLLKVPVDRRGECLRQLEYALDLYELAYGSTPPSNFTLTWRDDGNRSVDLSANGEPVLRLEVTDNPCWCHTCRAARPITLDDIRMVLCPTCGNKRCPKANDHRHECTNSNATGQPGSAWEHVKGVRNGG